MIKLNEITVKVTFNIDKYIEYCQDQGILPSQDNYREWVIQKMADCSEDELKVTYSKKERIFNNNKVEFVCLNEKLAKSLKRGHQLFKKKNGKIKLYGEFFEPILNSNHAQIGVVVQNKKSESLRHHWDLDKIFILKSSIKP